MNVDANSNFAVEVPSFQVDVECVGRATRRVDEDGIAVVGSEHGVVEHIS